MASDRTPAAGLPRLPRPRVALVTAVVAPFVVWAARRRRARPIPGVAGSACRPLTIGYLSGSPRIATRDDAGLSGPRAHIVGLIEALRRRGHVVEQFVLGDEIVESLTGLGSERLRMGGRVRQLGVDVVRLGLRLQVAWRARRRLPGPHDVVYERYALFQELGRSYQRDGALWVVETNAFLAREARHERQALALQRLAAALERRTYHRADLVVAISEPLRQMLVTELDVPASKVVVIPNAVDIERFAPGVAPYPEELVVGFVGFVIARQGLDELVCAVAALRRRGVSIRAVLVGDGPDRERLERLAAAEGVRDTVEFRGQVPWSHVPQHILDFAVGYSGQRGVGGMAMYHSPLKIYEYLAMARPVVASHHADAERTLVEAGAGWTFPAGDTDALTRTLDQVAALGTDALAKAGRRGREHVERYHTWDDRAARLVAEITRRRTPP